ncbi:MAG: precorrin-6y C5,15-methyltransferase (decarboxylating) subunit CbiE [Nitrospinae bacterium]|nr:precorrin-6y C5,15-methyltransferase (decarboxylating) subunit CbiE [Nitrospinota bacterium]
MAEKRITIIGFGPGGEDYVSPVARRKALEADCVIGSPRLLKLLPDSGQEKIPYGADTQKALEAIAERIPSRRVAVLVSGDPGISSLATPVIKKFGSGMCEVIPGVSSVQCAFAAVGLGWADARVVTAHASVPDSLLPSLMEEPKIAFLAGSDEAVRWIAGMAVKAGAGRRLFVCENLTLPEERVREFGPEELMTYKAPSMTVVLLIRKECFK